MYREMFVILMYMHTERVKLYRAKQSLQSNHGGASRPLKSRSRIKENIKGMLVYLDWQECIFFPK